MKRTKPFLSAAIVAALVAALYAAILDTAAYRAAVSAPDFKEQTAQQATRVEADTRRYAACSDLRDGKGALTTASRDCLIAAAGKAETEIGALLISAASTGWLVQHPDDSAVRAGALLAIERGRAALIGQAAYSRALKKVAEAHDRSVLLSFRDGKQDGWSKFGEMADRLDKAQYEVMLPDVARAQQEWRVKAVSS